MMRRRPRSTLFPYTDALPICADRDGRPHPAERAAVRVRAGGSGRAGAAAHAGRADGRLGPSRSAAAEHGAADRKSNTSELQSRQYLVCRLLLEKKHTPLIWTD